MTLCPAFSFYEKSQRELTFFTNYSIMWEVKYWGSLNNVNHKE